jgi:hypothetical protein
LILLALTAGMAAGGTVCPATEVLDSVVASIGFEAITASDVQQEYRFERFLDGQWPPPPPNRADLAAARERLADQILLIGEENPGAAEKAGSEKSAAGRLTALRKEFAHPEDYTRALKDLGLTEADVLTRLAKQDLTLLLIDERLRPAASPSDDEVANYYHSTFVPEFQKKNGGAAAPPLPQVDRQIREILTQKRISKLLDQWIEELKPTSSVRFHDF